MMAIRFALCAAPRLARPATATAARGARALSVHADRHAGQSPAVGAAPATDVPSGTRAKSTEAVGLEAAETGAGALTFVKALAPRFQTTAEIAVSKIFPAGAGWQTASVLADNAGFAADSLGFYLATGAGDFAGVFAGHTLFYALKKAAFDGSINMAKEAQTGLLLATAAFGSGFAWQLTLNQFQAASAPFMNAAVGTGAVCGLVFFGGLRVARAIYPKLGLEHIEEPSYLNLRNDAALSVAIGGATGMFVGTDVSYGAENIFRGFVGVEDHMSAALGVAKAGTSTAVGFVGVQAAMNAMLPAGRNWLDRA